MKQDKPMPIEMIPRWRDRLPDVSCLVVAWTVAVACVWAVVIWMEFAK